MPRLAVLLSIALLIVGNMVLPWIPVRGKPAVFLHGGPGTSEAPLFRHYNADLEREFLMVYWEQRGTGRSYRSSIPTASWAGRG